jgi:hypothetical protein
MTTSQHATPPDRGWLTLGWQVNAALVPRFWLDAAAKPGTMTNDDLYRIRGEDAGYHTAIIAQSGSGKSFFLGRFVEELLLETKARCIVFDPNADFRRVNEIVNENMWKDARYDHRTARGFLPHEKSAAQFQQNWSKISKRILGGPSINTPGSERYRLYWPSLSIEFIVDDAQHMRNELYHCHEFVKAIAELLLLKYGPSRARDRMFTFIEVPDPARPRQSERRSINLLNEAGRILRLIRRLGSTQEQREILTNEFDPENLAKTPLDYSSQFSIYWFLSHMHIGKGDIDQKIDRATAACEYLSEEAIRYYFGKAQEYVAQGIVRDELDEVQAESEKRARLEIIDLPSFPDIKTRLLVLNSVLETVWSEARFQWEKAVADPTGIDERVPIFVVLDEAHNLLPSKPRGLAAEALREQFRLIAAEGRKYGLFLVLCTQRPDKIDDLVLSECENRAIMKLGARSVLKITIKLLGLEDVPTPTLGKCLEFDTGRAVMIGRWAKDGPEIMYGAMRRTVEGGRNLRSSYWATPEISIGAEGTASREGANVRGATETAGAVVRDQGATKAADQEAQRTVEADGGTLAGGNPTPSPDSRSRSGRQKPGQRKPSKTSDD